jgi:Zn-dependent peptidase ImmA (M78 family)/transcriptional regulator with XRE-family HTH domain
MPLAEVLKHLRTNRRFELAAVAHATGISTSRLQEFEQGTREPTFRQVETLAETYGVPSYLLSIDAIPNLPESPTDFRRSVPAPAHLSPAAMQRVWDAEQVAQATKQLLGAAKASLATWAQNVNIEKPTPSNASALRKFFDDWLSTRKGKLAFTGTDEQKFFGALRLFVEAQGTVVRVNQAPPEDFLGFYLEPEEGVPTAFVNRKISSSKAQLFTLVHEYAHWILGASGISDPFRLKNQIERTCNEFAAEFIAPKEQFGRSVKALSRTIRIDVFKLVDSASKQSLLSKHATAIRLLETGYIDQKQLDHWLAKLVGEIGYLPTYVAGLALGKKLISSVDVMTSISLSQSVQDSAISLATRRFEVAAS